MKPKLFALLVVVIIVLVGLYLLLLGNMGEESSAVDDPKVEIMQEYASKFVYTVDTSLSATPYEEHCQARGGVFTTCGTICDTDAEICPEVCAYTCVLP